MLRMSGNNSKEGQPHVVGPLLCAWYSAEHREDEWSTPNYTASQQQCPILTHITTQPAYAPDVPGHTLPSAYPTPAKGESESRM